MQSKIKLNKSVRLISIFFLSLGVLFGITFLVIVAALIEGFIEQGMMEHEDLLINVVFFAIALLFVPAYLIYGIKLYREKIFSKLSLLYFKTMNLIYSIIYAFCGWVFGLAYAPVHFSYNIVVLLLFFLSGIHLLFFYSLFYSKIKNYLLEAK